MRMKSIMKSILFILRQSPIWAHLSYNSIGEVGSGLFLIIAQVIIAHAFGPAVYGVWTTLQLIVNYNNFIGFGFIPGLSQMEPLALGRQQYQKASALRNTAFFSSVLVSFFSSVVIFMIFSYCKFSFITQHPTYRYELPILLFLQQGYIFFQTTYQNHLAFKELAIGRLLYSIFFLIFVLFISYKNISDAFLLGWLGSFLVSVVYYTVSKKNLRPKLYYKKYYMGALFRIGSPIYIGGLIKLVISNIDKLLIPIFLSIEALGYYNVSAAFVLVITVIGSIVSRVFYPYLLREVGKNIQVKVIHDELMKACYITTECLSIICSLFSLILIPFVLIFLPAYDDAIYVGIIMIFVGYVMSVVQFMYVLLTVLRNNKPIIMIGLFIAVFLITIFYMIHRFYPVAGVTVYATIDLIVWVLYSVILYAFVCTRFLVEKSLFRFVYQIFIVGLLYPLSVNLLIAQLYFSSLGVVLKFYGIVIFLLFYILFKASSLSQQINTKFHLHKIEVGIPG